ncbi:hypothetical protein FT663_02699 [Candidozyma haemuli var. vulneris]|nr:hypothetical protein FT662_03813 [[Candida] haemuloni var. vulneris]KAF3991513.1 hypothetical protein FT663_02699 [[Candida] haemuloni var. vulneris]
MPSKSLQGNKILKSCSVCRQNKTKCDAAARRPHPCTYCSKKNLVCVFDVTKPSKRSYDLTEKLVAEVSELHNKLDHIIESKARLVRQFLRKTPSTPATPSDMMGALASSDSDSDASESNVPAYIDPIPTLSLSNSFAIHSNSAYEPWTISYDRALFLLQNFKENFLPYLPVLPESFFENPNLHDIHKQSDLLFWSIIVTSLLNQNSPEEYRILARHVQNLVVVSCWFNTPRSLYSLVTLLILTTWPLPDDRSPKVQSNISVKYISLMKSLSLQFGLHKLDFISEFSKKTDLQVAQKPDVNDIMRERIYKYVNINSNYWLVYLGLSNSNYNGFHQDYIINKSANIDIFNKDSFDGTDNFINSLLKISLIQSKMNESMNDVVESSNKMSKLIHLNMFEQILSDFSKKESTPLVKDNLIAMSLEFSKLQLYIYYFSKVDIALDEYRDVIYRAINCCSAILDLFGKSFGNVGNFNQIPMHYRFCIELASLVLLDIHSSPLLRSISDYQFVKSKFSEAYSYLSRCVGDRSSSTNRLMKIITKFDSCNKAKLLALRSKEQSFFLINKMSNYLISGLHYELIWHVYQTERHESDEELTQIDWSLFGLNPKIPQHQSIMNYVLDSSSIFA